MQGTASSGPLGQATSAGRSDLVVLKGVRKSFGDSEVLRGIDLTCRRGETTCIVGGSGAGKTTLLRLVVALEKPTSGSIFVEGEDIVPMREYDLNRIRQKFGMVYQYAALLDSINVLDNVSFPLIEHTKMPKPEIRQRVLDKLKILGLDESVLKKYPAELSGGMRKRVGLARALMLDPPIVVSDERSRPGDEPRGGRPHRRHAAPVRCHEPRHHARHRQLFPPRRPGRAPRQGADRGPRSPARPGERRKRGGARLYPPLGGRRVVHRPGPRRRGGAGALGIGVRDEPIASLSAILQAGPSMQPYPPPPPQPPAAFPGWPPQGLPPQGPPPPPSPPPRETKAAASLALAVLSVVGAMCGVGLSLGLPAIILGVLAHRDIRRAGANGRYASGAGLATAGIILGTIGSMLFVGWLGIVAYAVFSPSSPASLASPDPAAPRPAVPAVGPSHDPAVQLHSSGGALRTQLTAQASLATRAGEAVLVETSMASCDPCSEIEQAVPDPSVQQALAKVRLLRIDVAEFRSELPGLRMNEPTVPWFYLLDSRGQPRDAISADEWDDNDAENIAPVLGAFVHDKLQPRRTTWRGRTSL
jgi:ABC-type polar amino acid transport system ATPase subunit